jgi:Zn finger protein HypA/HybF involved in hydrogenase expression
MRRFNNDPTATRDQKERRASLLDTAVHAGQADGTCHFCGETDSVGRFNLLCDECDSELLDLEGDTDNDAGDEDDDSR